MIAGNVVGGDISAKMPATIATMPNANVQPHLLPKPRSIIASTAACYSSETRSKVSGPERDEPASPDDDRA